MLAALLAAAVPVALLAPTLAGSGGRVVAATAPAAAPPTAPAAPATTGPLVAQACLGCHGADGRGAGPMAGLAGRDAAELADLMRQFRAGERPATIMTRIARGYSEAEIEATVAWFAASGAGEAR